MIALMRATKLLLPQAIFQVTLGVSSAAQTLVTFQTIAARNSGESNIRTATTSQQSPTSLFIVTSQHLPNNSFKPTPLRGAA